MTVWKDFKGRIRSDGNYDGKAVTPINASSESSVIRNPFKKNKEKVVDENLKKMLEQEAIKRNQRGSLPAPTRYIGSPIAGTVVSEDRASKLGAMPVDVMKKKAEKMQESASGKTDSNDTTAKDYTTGKNENRNRSQDEIPKEATPEDNRKTYDDWSRIMKGEDVSEPEPEPEPEPEKEKEKTMPKEETKNTTQSFKGTKPKDAKKTVSAETKSRFNSKLNNAMYEIQKPHTIWTQRTTEALVDDKGDKIEDIILFNIPTSKIPSNILTRIKRLAGIEKSGVDVIFNENFVQIPIESSKSLGQTTKIFELWGEKRRPEGKDAKGNIKQQSRYKPNFFTTNPNDWLKYRARLRVVGAEAGIPDLDFDVSKLSSSQVGALENIFHAIKNPYQEK